MSIAHCTSELSPVRAGKEGTHVRFVRSLLFEVEPISSSSLGLPVLFLLAVALVAAWSPARRATRVDPAEALRVD